MSKKLLSEAQILSIIMFIFSVICLCITLKLFGDMQSYVDERELSYYMIGVDQFGLMLNWLRVALAGILALLSLLNLFVHFSSTERSGVKIEK